MIGCGNGWRWFGVFVIFVGILAPIGCDKGGPARYDVSGTVTYQGQPVPIGSIVFEPDSTKGNSGASGSAQIKDGKYDTREEDGTGTIGGPHLVRILGLDGKPDGELTRGTPLFPEYGTTIDLPKETTTHDFDVPEGGGSTSPKSQAQGYSDV